MSSAVSRVPPPQLVIAPEDLSGLLGVTFSAEQLAAASAPLEPALVLAGAGSGKTSVMAARVVWLVLTGQVQAADVLGLTFTRKAAGELQARIERGLTRAGLVVTGDGSGRTGDAHAGLDAAPGADAGLDSDAGPQVLTYHAYAGLLVRAHGLRLGVEPDARLLADATRFQLAARVVRRAAGPLVHLPRSVPDVVAALMDLDGELSEHAVSPAEVREWTATVLPGLDAAVLAVEGVKGRKGEWDDLRQVQTCTRRRLELLGLVEAYRAAKRAGDQIDFSDQVALASRAAAELGDVAAAERARWPVVLLDEYQDTSVAQRRLLATLFGGGHPVTAVGDPCQAIYGWRGASVANLDSFPRHFPLPDGRPAPRYSLAVNHRSGGRILSAANALAESLHRTHDAAPLRCPPGGESAGRVLVAVHPTMPEELGWMARQIRAAIETRPGASWRDAAVLVRARADIPAVHAALGAEGLPVQVLGLAGLLSVPAVADLVATLQVLDDPSANAALVRLLAGPRWAVGPADLAALGRRASDLVSAAERTAGTARAVELLSGLDPSETVSLPEALEDLGSRGFTRTGRRRLTAAAAELRELRTHLAEPLVDLMTRVTRVTGLGVEVAASPAARDAGGRQALDALLDFAAGFTDLDGGGGLHAFLGFLAASEQYERGLDLAPVASTDAVSLLTVHRAKGLEWLVVALPNLTEATFPSRPRSHRWTTTAALLPLPLREDIAGSAEPLAEPARWDRSGLAEFSAACNRRQALEERRLAYVAATRARDLLIASSARWGLTQKKPRRPSEYLEALRVACENGAGEVELWTAQPGDRERNPLLGGEPVSWPAPLLAGPARDRQLAADRVRAALGRPVAPAATDAAGEPPGQCRGDRAAGESAEPAGSEPEEQDELAGEEWARVAAWDEDVSLLLAEAGAEHQPVRDVSLPATVSVTQVMRAARDPAGLARDLVRPMPRLPGGPTRRGIRFHAWVEQHFGLRPLFDEQDLDGAQDADLGLDADLVALQEAFLGTEWAERVPFAVEAPFELPLGGRLVRGRIDAVYRDAPGWHVVDFKTGGEDADPLQLALYRLAWSALQDVALEQIRASFLYVRTGRLVSVPDLPGAEELGRLCAGGSWPGG